MRIAGDDTAHALIGHGAYLQQYQRRTDEEKMEFWQEIEPEILIGENKKKQVKKEIENDLRDRKIEELQKQLTDYNQKLELLYNKTKPVKTQYQN